MQPTPKQVPLTLLVLLQVAISAASLVVEIVAGRMLAPYVGIRYRVLARMEGGKEVLEAPLPAVLTAQKGLNEVRYASLKGIMAVKRKQIPVYKDL